MRSQAWGPNPKGLVCLGKEEEILGLSVHREKATWEQSEKAKQRGLRRAQLCQYLDRHLPAFRTVLYLVLPSQEASQCSETFSTSPLLIQHLLFRISQAIRLKWKNLTFRAKMKYHMKWGNLSHMREENSTFDGYGSTMHQPWEHQLPWELMWEKAVIEVY